MAKSLLRSGNLDDYQAVGGGGQAVFESALQIRETLRLRKQQAMVDCLAIPQLNDNGDRVDWYSPIEGQAIAWKAADEETRSRALRYLASTFESAAALSRKSLQSGKTALQLFGSLLEKATQFPSENHVFLVNGKPVITFWGFVNLNEKEAPVIIAAIPKDALVMDSTQMKLGTTRFLNGSWRVSVDVKDPITGKPPSLRYQIQNNKGIARVVHGDNVVCRAEIFSGLHQTGELMIKSRGNARCTDGSRYPMPEITCKAGVNDVATCTARYGDHAAIPLTFKKIGA
ncbi:TPA: hypothetical protein JEU86_003063 [Salmonella enterica subsp. enterica serovar Dublin]|nr:hypothetical protein [Salmonella enterica subsp. enterica serovar Dublin]HAU8419747.1 hypothetical protein [Salmonella enterica subsp. enterica serovar Dublin]HAU8432987.1 hypothetical protein [Salmonella enterica subsp. enterica serovar Dublin]HAU8469243.1 hypothetical protein [Salmonella enterica subsp. enterica serovar Dublin]HAU8480160.1 hypothetical protein [Salmonella enterica subsp. enterica serovar Dublin]